jgi:hypothetical protein
MPNSLLELMKFHGTDKAGHRYDIPYTFFLEPRRHEFRKVLEIGVKKGSSLRLWEEYFPQAQVYGIDIDPNCRHVAGDRRHVLIGSQKDSIFLAEVAAKLGNDVDMIVDDGAHMSDHQLVSLVSLWQCLRVGGLYVIEDTHAHLKPLAKFNNKKCKYPPFSTMLQKRVKAYWDGARCKETKPGIVSYPGLVIFIKTHDTPPPNFLHMKKQRRRG